jgi:hypothetical protein
LRIGSPRDLPPLVPRTAASEAAMRPLSCALRALSFSRILFVTQSDFHSTSSSHENNDCSLFHIRRLRRCLRPGIQRPRRDHSETRCSAHANCRSDSEWIKKPVPALPPSNSFAMPRSTFIRFAVTPQRRVPSASNGRNESSPPRKSGKPPRKNVSRQGPQGQRMSCSQRNAFSRQSKSSWNCKP